MADEFRTTEVGARYAKALFDLAGETGRLDAVRDDLAALRAAWDGSADLRRLPAVIAGFDALYAQQAGIVSAEVVSASALEAGQLRSIKAALTQALGKDPEMTARVDSSLLGGLKVRVGSRLFDASLKTKLDQMKFALKRA